MDNCERNARNDWNPMHFFLTLLHIAFFAQCLECATTLFVLRSAAALGNIFKLATAQLIDNLGGAFCA